MTNLPGPGHRRRCAADGAPHGPNWISSLAQLGPDEIANDFNLSPSRFIGLAWLVVGVPLAAWLTLRGRLGWASLAVSPYLLPYYVQMLGLELVEPRSPQPDGDGKAT